MKRIIVLIFAVATLLLAIAMWQKHVDYRRAKKYPRCEVILVTPNGNYDFKNIQYSMSGKNIILFFKPHEWYYTNIMKGVHTRP